MKTTIFFSLILSVFVFGTLHAQSEPSKEEVTSLTNQFKNAYNAGEIANLQQMYTDDATVIFADGQTISGREQINSWLANQLKSIEAVLTFGEWKTSWSDAEHAYLASGTYKIDGKTITDGKDIKVSAAYANVLQKVGNEWKIAKTTFTALP